MGNEEPKATILIVDDERGPRDSLRMILSPAYRVLQATSGADALDCAIDLGLLGGPGEAVAESGGARLKGVVEAGLGDGENHQEPKPSQPLGLAFHLPPLFIVCFHSHGPIADRTGRILLLQSAD